MWFVYILRALLGWVDGALYRLAAELYDLMIQIASAKVFQQETIMTVSGRVYQLLGLIMLFKLIFSFITYVINPDDMTDKNKGYANLVKKIIISLCLIVITPWAFTQSRNLQIYIIEDKVIEYFVFGQTKPSNASAGYNLMYTVGKQFVIPYKCNDDTNECKKISNRDDKVLCDSDWDEHLPNIDPDDGSFSGSDANYCAYGAKEDPEYAKLLYKATHLSDDGKYDFNALMAKIPTSYNGSGIDWLLKSDKTDFYVDYQIIVSTGVVVAVIYMLVIMCIDMAVRSVKLSFYEIIAPIPIISYVGFKDGKDSMLNKWFGQVLKTYADLFTRVAGLQIAVFFIDQLADDKFENSGNIFVNIFLILGALTFAKELPKILEGMGIKFDGGGFNLKKKLTDDMAGSKLLRRAGAAGLGLAGGMAANAYKGVSNAYKNHKSNQELKDAMRAQGHTKFGAKEREKFYSRNQNDSDMMKLGSARFRRQYQGSKSGLAARKSEAQQAKLENMRKIGQEETAALTAARNRGASGQEIANIRAEYANRMQNAINQGDAAIKEAGKKRVARREFTQEHASEFGGGVRSVIAGGVSAAARAATSKDGKMFSGAASGIKGSVDARDLRDKRQESDYGFGDRTWDAVRTFAGVDTVAKSRANELHDEINELQLKANAAQKKYTDATTPADRDAAMAEYKKLQSSITKTQKKLEKLYESSGKK